MTFSNTHLENNYRQLGFVPDGLGLKLKIGSVELVAVEYPLNGVAVFFNSVTPDKATEFEIALPVTCSSELVAGMIYVNFARNFPEDAAMCKKRFQALKIPLFQ